jgi:hypothetical protein
VIDNSRTTASLPVTDSGPRPGDFPVGSIESRVAAGALAGNKKEVKEILRVDVKHISASASELPASSRHECENCIIEIIHRGS